MRALNTLYVTGHRSQLKLQKGTVLVVDPEHGNTRVPLRALDAIVLLGNAQPTSQLMAACSRQHVRLTALRRNGAVGFTVGGPIGGNVHLRLAQYRAADDPERSARIARVIVAGKLRNCQVLLRRWGEGAEGAVAWTLRDNLDVIQRRIHALPGTTDGDKIRGIEGDAARRYFKGMRAALYGCGFEFASRNRRPPRDPVNALLSFTYGLVLSEIIGSLETVGLDPQVGYLHQIRVGRPSLALDLLEEFRPALADRFVVALLRRRQITDEDFTYTVGGACHLTDAGRQLLLAAYEAHRDTEVGHPLLQRSVPRWSLPLLQATLMARHLRGDLPEYPPFVAAA